VGRVRRGFKLAGVSWRVVLAEPAILLVLLAGLIGTVVLSGGAFALLFRRLPDAHDLRFPNYLVALPVLWFGTIASSYCNVVVAVIADRRLRGDDASVSDGLSVATSKLDRILSWTVVSIVVGTFLHALAERVKLGGLLASRLFGLAWGLATTFVVPVLALEDVNVKDAISRSSSIFKRKWGEAVVAEGTVGLAVFVVMIPAFVVVGVTFAIAIPLGVCTAVVAVGLLMIVSGALDAVVRVALYRYAIDGEVLGAFTAADLDASFRPKTGRLFG